jgi:hypothetical protein
LGVDGPSIGIKPLRTHSFPLHGFFSTTKARQDLGEANRVGTQLSELHRIRAYPAILNKILHGFSYLITFDTTRSRRYW